VVSVWDVLAVTVREAEVVPDATKADGLTVLDRVFDTELEGAELRLLAAVPDPVAVADVVELSLN
jgi:hypothetical protein